MIARTRAAVADVRWFPRTSWIGIAGLGLMLVATAVPAQASPRTRMESLTNRDTRVQFAIEAGDFHTCALRGDGTVRCWGRGGNGRLGNDNTADQSRPVDVRTITTAVAVSGGELHTCALLVGGTVQCWGGNNNGQLGNNSRADSDTPVTVVELSGVDLSGAVAVSAGRLHTCALIADGTVRCWGFNDSGQLGDGTTERRFTPVPVPNLINVTALAAGRTHTCALVASGSVQCWGSNFNGRLGDGTTTNQLRPVAVRGLDSVVAISASDHTCAVRADGTVMCWGPNSNGQLGDGTTTDRPTPVFVPDTGPLAPDGVLSHTTTISAGQLHTCVLRADGRVRCWGRNFFGQLGDGTFTDRFTPGVVGGLTTAVAVTVGSGHTCALLGDGALRCWGSSLFGVLGNGTAGTSSDSPRPAAVVGGGGGISARDIGAGGGLTGPGHTCAVRANGGAACWGSNFRGQLGNNDPTEAPVPAPAAVPINNATGVTGGDAHTCALRANGTVFCWGRNRFGAVGAASNSDQHDVPVEVHECRSVEGNPLAPCRQFADDRLLAGVVGVSAGNEHACAVRAVGSVHCWGGNNFGEVDGSVNVIRFSAVPVPSPVTEATGPRLSNIVAVTGAFTHTCALVADGTVRCWGDNRNGQLGDGTTGTGISPPVTVRGLSNAVAIAAGNLHTCALSARGTVVCWGVNGSGELGDGTTEPRSEPVIVTIMPGVALTGVVAIAAAGRHTCALLADGSVRCWGENGFGQLGLGGNSTTDRLRPVPVPGLANVVAIAAGLGHTCAVRVDGAVFCWGANGLGQAGQDPATAPTVPSPEQVASFLANVEEDATLASNGHRVLLTAVVNCPVDLRVTIEMSLTQGTATGRGRTQGKCEGGLAEYPMHVSARRGKTFSRGPAEAEITATVRDGRTVIDVQVWNRIVEIDTASGGHRSSGAGLTFR